MIAEKRMAMLIDVTKCMGCRGCQVACKQWNQLPAAKTRNTGTYQNPPELSANTWTLVNFIEPDVSRDEFERNPQWFFRKQQCLHCGDPACVHACPTGALKQRHDGIVYIDQAICAGCKYCVEVCPFGTPHPNHETGTAMKCRMCLDRVDDGMQPACVTACPTGALEFGTRTAMLDLAEKRMAVLRKAGGSPYLYGEKELGGLGAMYLLPENNPELFNLPRDPQLPTNKIFIRWLLGVVPGLAILYGMWRYFQKEETATPSSGGN